jgi:stress-induced morphogen
MDFLGKVRTLLTKTFRPPDQVDVREEDGVIGVVVSRRFRNLDTIDRQSMIGNLLRKGLEPEERKRILMIVAVTPEEQIGHTSI